MELLHILPDVGIVTTESLMTEAAELQAALAASTVVLFKDSMPAITGETTAAVVLANECDFDGYTPGGNTITAFGDPFEDPDGDGVLIVAPTTQFNYETPEVGDPVTNLVKGFALLDADGNLRGVRVYDDVIPMEDDSDSIPVVIARRIS